MDREFWNESFKQDPQSTHVKDFFLQAEIKNLKPGKALDLGCGAGINALMLAESGWSVTGVDWSEHAIKLAKRSAFQSELDAEFIVGDITSWIPEDKFDLAISTYALPGGSDSIKVLKTAASAVKQGGTLIVAEWDASMAQVWGFDPEDLVTPDQIVAHLPGMKIELAEVRHVKNPFFDDGSGKKKDNSANVAFVRAKLS